MNRLSLRSLKRLWWPLMVAGALFAWAVMAWAAPPAGDAAVVRALRDGGVAVLVRHAQTTPGVGDPPGMALGNCASQRNLNDEGRAQAKRLGEWFRKHRVQPTAVRNSVWCRARDTARLAFGRHDDWPALNNLFDDRSRQAEQTAEVHRYLGELRAGQLAVLVSHGVTINAFAGEALAQGEAVVVRAERDTQGVLQVRTVGRFAVP
jgi:broad specificity phosphatase PhoE